MSPFLNILNTKIEEQTCMKMAGVRIMSMKITDVGIASMRTTGVGIVLMRTTFRVCFMEKLI